MYTDFSSILTLLTLICGLIWAIDAGIFKRRRNKETKEPKLVEYARSFFPILLVVCILRSFIVEPFRIPSGSMKPTLLEGDFILVNKYVYGIRLPIIGQKIIKVNEPKRGDILVFRFPNDTSVNFIKRVIGLPGDKIAYKDKVLYINDNIIHQEFLGTVYETYNQGRYLVKHFKEDLPGQPHSIYIHQNAPNAMEQEFVVPKGNYFVMGDNRDNSEDSRVWGFVPENLILGKAFFVWMSWDQPAKDIRWRRMGRAISQ